MNNLIFLKPIFHEKIWGGTSLRTMFNYEIPSEKTGECWAISAHPNGDCEIIDSHHGRKTLSYLWNHHRELFGNIQGDVFPLLMKILDVSEDLSVQVHPNNEYALKEAGELGKAECWYILDAHDDAELIFGHHAKTKEEFIKQIELNNWDQLLRKVKVKKGDFFYVPAGTLHALKKGTIVLETQQSSDTTYRLYDYNRLGDDGYPRPLHLQQSIDVTIIPHQETKPELKQHILDDSTITTLIECEFFKVYKWEIKGKCHALHQPPFTLVSVLEGEGLINYRPIQKGDHFIITSIVTQLKIEGNLELMVATI